MIHLKRIAAAGLLMLVVLAAWPAMAANNYGRNYSLHTIDYRIAESLVWDLCERAGGKSDQCMVQASGPGSLTVFASQDIHARVVKMLSERDRRVPSSLLFEIVLIRLAEDGAGEGSSRENRPQAEHIRNAIDAVLEIFPDRHPEVIDTGLIRTVSEGSTLVGNERDGYYNAALALRTTIGGATGLEFTVDLRVTRRNDDLGELLLVSTLTLAEGETVVAGSSRVGGEPAIVVLLTSKLD